MEDPYLLRISTIDWQVHAFTAGQEDPTWVGLCGNNFHTEALEEVFDPTPTHQPCIMRFAQAVEAHLNQLRAKGVRFYEL